jgi:hypothetical protein
MKSDSGAFMAAALEAFPPHCDALASGAALALSAFADRNQYPGLKFLQQLEQWSG